MAKTISRYCMNTLLVTFSIVLVMTFTQAAQAQPQESRRISEAQSAGELIQIYAGSNNAVTRRQAIQALSLLSEPPEVTRSLSRAQTTESVAPPADDSVYELLDLGLGDPSISVVKETIRQIGGLRLDVYNKTLIEMFDAVDSRFPGSQKEIQSLIIQALSQTGGDEANPLFRQILGSGEVNYRTDKVLQAVRDMQDVSLLDAVKAYAENVEDLMAAMGNTPETRPRYAMYMQSLQLARSVQKLLSEK
jgi:hypothetical protein